MASTPAIAAGYLSDEAEREEAEMQTAFEQLVSWIKELVGASADGATVNIASGVIPIVSNISTYMVDSEGGSGADDLGYISGTARDGQLVALRLFNAARPISILNGAGGAGQILTKNGQTLVLSSLKQFAIFKYVASGDYYEEWLRDETARIDLLLGSLPASTLTVATSSITVDRARHLVTSSTTTNIDLFAGITNFLAGGLLLLTQADSTYVRTLRHNIGSADGRLNLLGGVSQPMVPGAGYLFVRNGLVWDQIGTISAKALPMSSAAGKIFIGDGSGGWSESGGTLAKGSIPVGTGSSDFGYLAVGANGTIPYADSTQATGIKWDNPSSGGSLYGDGADGAKTISTNTTETVSKTFRLTTLTIQTGCTWTVKSGTLILCTGAVDIQGTGKLVVSADIPGGTGGTATTRWRATGGGPSPGSCDTNNIYYVPGGAGCGGAGGDGGYVAASSASGGKGGAAVYPYPGVTGSGGGAGTFCGNPAVPGNGGSGGGSVGLYSGSTVTIGASAKIEANGGAGTAQSDSYGVAGSGGSGGVVDIGAQTSIINSGTIEAKGGVGGNAVNSGYYAPGGGGGIVCLTSPSITAGTITLTGGAKGSGGAAHDVVPTAGSTGTSYSTTAVPVKYRCF